MNFRFGNVNHKIKMYALTSKHLFLTSVVVIASWDLLATCRIGIMEPGLMWIGI